MDSTTAPASNNQTASTNNAPSTSPTSYVATKTSCRTTTSTSTCSKSRGRRIALSDDSAYDNPESFDDGANDSTTAAMRDRCAGKYAAGSGGGGAGAVRVQAGVFIRRRGRLRDQPGPGVLNANMAPGGVKAGCSNCGMTPTGLWRRGLDDELDSNVCGLYCKLVGDFFFFLFFWSCDASSLLGLPTLL
jgi:hypothetical protein